MYNRIINERGENKMKDALILTVLYDDYKQLEELFPVTQIVNIQDLKLIDYFTSNKCIAIIVDVDHLPTLALDDLLNSTSRYHSKIIYTSNSIDAIRYLKKYGLAVEKNIEQIAKHILDAYTGLVRQKRGNYVFDYENRTVTNLHSVYKIQNTPFLIFNHLVKNKNKVCSRNELLEVVYSYQIENGCMDVKMLSDVRKVDVHIHNLRKTTKDDRIKTIINEGYMFEDKEENKDH